MICRIVFVTFPRLAGFGRHIKNMFEVRCMPLWDLEELSTVYTTIYDGKGWNSTVFSTQVWENVEMSFELWGGIPRI